MKLKLAEKPYYAVQGEGPNTGVPVIFLRFFGCNLRCTWCDTKYTWEKECIKVENIIDIDVDELVKLLEEFDTKKIRHIVITGGEPTLQIQALDKLAIDLSALGWYLEIETNGSLPVGKEFVSLFDCYNVSPKRENSGNSLTQSENTGNFKLFSEERVNMKFVVHNEEDMLDIVSICNKYSYKPEFVYLMPEGLTKEDVLDKSAWVINQCVEHGFNFSTRLHILVYGNKQGV